ncbi:sin3 complex subunit [Phlyctema vagabunda]|uniref:Sin3 complex subunit n=1 Tax=Phlyctema vagabunda TaxID=108571 RepID=A0ABR4PJD1_9HELO
MSSRFSFPSAYDPHMHREEVVTLSRTTSQHAGIHKVNTGSVSNNKNNNASPKPVMSIPKQTAPDATTSTPQRPNICRYLEDDPSTVVIERRGDLKGYEIYIVEQWACSRVHPTFIITTYTGDPGHSVTVGVLGVPANEETWSPRLRVYFKAVSQFHARPKETPLGMLMVTNLSSFPSALTVILVPDGDVKKHREDFVVNEDLKRLGCSGRSGMSLANPTGATQAKFHQLYKTSDRIPLYGSVIELVKLCQVALMMFGRLEQEYADGLLCDVTEKAVNDWWTEIGSEYYNIEPADGILGPTTVAALLGMLIGARNRLNYYGAPVAKDSFDIFSLKRGIAYFQKSQKMERTRRLDRHTLHRLHRVTAKAAAGEGWAVPKAVKSTVAELSGKGGEMVMGMVGGRDKAGIGDIETLDIDRFVGLVHGERAKWLWHGKPRRGTTGDHFGRAESDTHNMIFSKDEHGGYVWSNKRTGSNPPEEDAELLKKESPTPVYSNKPPGSATSMAESPNEKDLQLRKAVFKSVTGKIGDARSGFGRIKDAVGLRGHNSKQSRDDIGFFSPVNSAPDTGVPSSPSGIAKTFTWKSKPEEYQNGQPKEKNLVPDPPKSSAHGSESPPNGSQGSLPTIEVQSEQRVAEKEAQWTAQAKEIRHDLVINEPSVAGSIYGEGDLECPLLEPERDPNNFEVLLHRRHSIPGDSPTPHIPRNEAWWPRQMSFSDAADAVLGWDPIGAPDADDGEDDPWAVLQKQKYLAEDFKNLFEKVSYVKNDIGNWVGSKVMGIESLDYQAAQDLEELQALFYQLTETYHAIKQSSQDAIGEDRSQVMESIKDVEMLGAKLEYEINALVSKIQDVEDGVAQFERQVDDLEVYATELENQLKTESWAHWFVRSLTGIGTGPPVEEVIRP